MTYRLPSLNALRGFEAAARNLNYRMAAEELGVTSGAVSQQVKNLEHSLGVTLFVRLPRGLALTEAGERYLPRVTKVFDDLTAATEDIAPALNGKKFTVGVAPAAAAVLPKGWPRDRAELAPHVRDRVETAEVKDVVDGGVDCLVTSGSASSGDLHEIVLRGSADGPAEAYRIVLYCRPGLAECRQTSAIVADLESLLLDGTDCDRE